MKKNIKQQTKVKALISLLEKYSGKKVTLKENGIVNPVKTINYQEIIYKANNANIFQNWVDDIFAMLESSVGPNGFSEEQLKDMTTSCIEQLKDVVEENIDTYFHPERV